MVACLFRGANGSLACFIFLGGVSEVRSTSSVLGGDILTDCIPTVSSECISEIVPKMHGWYNWFGDLFKSKLNLYKIRRNIFNSILDNNPN